MQICWALVRICWTKRNLILSSHVHARFHEGHDERSNQGYVRRYERGPGAGPVRRTRADKCSMGMYQESICRLSVFGDVLLGLTQVQFIVYEYKPAFDPPSL